MFGLDGYDVYTPVGKGVTVDDFVGAEVTRTKLLQAYFFRLADGGVIRTSFTREDIESGNSNLMLEVDVGHPPTGVRLGGLDDTLGFLVRCDCIGRSISGLAGRPVRVYSQEKNIIGISPQA